MVKFGIFRPRRYSYYNWQLRVKKTSIKIPKKRERSNLKASSMSHGKLVAAKTITILRVPSSLVELLFTPSTWTRSSDFTLLDDSCSPDALKKRSYCELRFNIGTKHIWQIIFTINSHFSSKWTYSLIWFEVQHVYRK